MKYRNRSLSEIHEGWPTRNDGKYIGLTALLGSITLDDFVLMLFFLVIEAFCPTPPFSVGDALNNDSNLSISESSISMLCQN